MVTTAETMGNAEESNDEVEIRSWTQADISQLRPMVQGFIVSAIGRGGDIADTPKNVEWFLRKGLECAEAGFPVLVGCVDDAIMEEKAIAGYLTWAEIPTPLDARWKTITAYGTYTLPEYRGQGIAGKLRVKAFEMTCDLGYERIVGPIHALNPRGMQEFEEVWGAKIVAHQFEKFLK